MHSQAVEDNKLLSKRTIPTTPLQVRDSQRCSFQLVDLDDLVRSAAVSLKVSIPDSTALLQLKHVRRNKVVNTRLPASDWMAVPEYCLHRC